MLRARRATAVAAAAVAVAFAVVASLAACGDGGTPAIDAGGETAAGARAVTVVGENLRFDVTEIRARAGQEVVVTFRNADPGVLHNFHVDGDDEGQFATDLEAGPVTQELRVLIEAPGRYDYVCDAHVDTMRGTLIVE